MSARRTILFENEYIEVRAADTGDMSVIVDMWHRLQIEVVGEPCLAADAEKLYRRDLTEWIRGEATSVLVAVRRDGDLALGFLTAHLVYPLPIYQPDLEVLVQDLFVDPGSRRLGVGSALIQCLIRNLPASKVSEIVLCTPATNTVGLKFWKSAGFSARAIELSRLVGEPGDRV